MSKKFSLPIAIIFPLLLILSLSSLRIISYLSIILLTAYLLPVKANAFTKLLLGILSFYSIVTVVGAVSFVLNISVLPVTIVLTATALILYLSGVKKGAIQFESSGTVLKGISYWLVIAFMITVYICIPLFSGGSNQIFKMVSFGGDNISHLELVKSVNESRGYFYKPPATTKTKISEGLSGYPQGMHLNFYVLADAFKPFVNIYSTGKRLATAYYIYVSAMYVLLLLITIQSAIFLQEKKSSKKSRVLTSLLILVLFGGLFFSLFALGFQTQVVALSLFVAMMIYLSEAGSTATAHWKKLYGMAGLALTGISFSWLFLLPVAGFVLLVLLAGEIRIRSVKILRDPLLMVPMIILGTIALIQPIVQVIYKSTKLIGVNEIGFTQRPNVLVVGCIILSVVFLIIQRHSESKFTPWIIGLVGSILFSGTIAAYNLSTIGEVRYYYYKSLFTILLVSVVVGSSIIGRLAIEKSQKLSRIQERIGFLVLVLGLALAVSYNITNKSDYFVLKNSGGISGELADTALAEVSGPLNPSEASSIIAIGSCNRAQDYTVTRLVGALGGVNNDARQALLASLLSPEKSELLSAIKIYQVKVGNPLTIYSTDKDLQQYFAIGLSDDSIPETFVDLDFGTQQKTVMTCPNIVR